VLSPFEQIVAAHGATVLRVCRTVVGPDDGEDAWSETFLAALRAYPELPADANVEAWLVTIAHRKCLDLLRRRAARPVPAPATDLPAPEPADGSIWEAVRALPAKQRQAVAYHYFVGLPYAEIAQLVGGTPEAARRAASDAMKTLRRTLSKEAI
jgi:RNA polymerase sigma factor (sigma-70 family)